MCVEWSRHTARPTGEGERRRVESSPSVVRSGVETRGTSRGKRKVDDVGGEIWVVSRERGSIGFLRFLRLRSGKG